ncbi:hypothetical protein IJG29_03050, partial [Candidatus Saccharibacteria bacterium]|nr:hypothetical protein [Candidatus Saccharibacteria bacterium]
MYYEVIPGKTNAPELLTYSFDGEIEPGTLVEVTVGRAKVPGVVIKKVARPEFECKPITRILYSTP